MRFRTLANMSREERNAWAKKTEQEIRDGKHPKAVRVTALAIGVFIVAASMWSMHDASQQAERRAQIRAEQAAKERTERAYRAAMEKPKIDVNYKYALSQDLPKISGCESVIDVNTMEIHHVGEDAFVSCRALLNGEPCDIFAMYDGQGKIYQLKINNHAVYTRGGKQN